MLREEVFSEGQDKEVSGKISGMSRPCQAPLWQRGFFAAPGRESGPGKRRAGGVTKERKQRKEGTF